MANLWEGDNCVCSSCKCMLHGEKYVTLSCMPKCRECYNKEHGKKCKKCNEYIIGRVLMAIGADWHPDCFQCKKCLKPVEDLMYHEIDGQPMHLACSCMEHSILA